MEPKLSVIIPCYNSENTIEPCLKHLLALTYTNFEVIVVDDASTDNSVQTVRDFNYVLIELDKNSGPANARNVGAEAAKGEILFFLDSDVLLKSDALGFISADFEDNPDVGAVVGIYSKRPANDSPFSWYFALRKFSNWSLSNQKTYSTFPTRLSGVRRKIFFEVGGFDTAYEGADVEDYEFGYRLAEKYAVLVDTRVEGSHFNPSFGKCFGNYFKRSFQWIRLFIERKKFDNITTTKSAGLVTGFGALSCVFFVLLSISIYYFPILTGLLLPSFFVSLGIFLIGNLHFYLFCAREKGTLFASYALVVSYILSLAVGLGVSMSFLTFLIDRLRRRSV